jgi:hypothetical protein
MRKNTAGSKAGGAVVDGRALVGAVAMLAAALGCGGGTNEPPPRTPTAAEGATAPDGGLLPPPRSTKKGIIVPSDMGLGEGPSGPATTSGTRPSESPVLGSPNVGN